MFGSNLTFIIIAAVCIVLCTCFIGYSQSFKKDFDDNNWRIIVASGGQLYFIDPNGKNHPVFDVQGQEEGSFANYPTFSPCGKKFAYCLLKKSITHLLEYDLIKKIRRQLYETRLGIRNPSWSPDGKRIVFLTNYDEKNNSFDLCTIDIPSLKVHVVADHIVNAAEVCTPTWLHDSSAILFTGLNGQIMEVDLNMNDTSVFLNGSCPSCSPDGSYMVYRHGREGLKIRGGWIKQRFGETSDFYILNLQNKTEKLLFRNKRLFGFGPTILGPVLWSPDTQYVMYFKTFDFPNIMKVDLIHLETGKRFSFETGRSFSSGAIDWVKY